MPLSTAEGDDDGTPYGVFVAVAVFLVGIADGDKVGVGVIVGAGVEVG